jgi:MFS family permease
MTLWIPFLDNVNRLFQKRFCYTQITAGRVVTVAYLATTVTSIPLGLFVDYFGHRRILCIAGLLVFLVAQFIILVYPQCNGEDTLGGAVAGLYL